MVDGRNRALASVTWRDGKRNGTAELHWNNGKVRATVDYAEGRKQGEECSAVSEPGA